MKSVFLIGLTIAVVYLLFPTKVYYWDGIAFAQAIEDARGLSISLVHPNHLVYNFVGYGFYKLVHAVGFDVRAVTALQILNSLLGAACAGVMLLILKDVFRSLYFAVCLSLLFAFSATWWKFSTDANAYVPSVLLLLLSFYLVLPDRKRRPVLLSLTFFAAVCFHQLAVLAYPVFALGVYLQDGSISVKHRVRHALIFSVSAFVLIAGIYGFFFYRATGTFGVGSLIRWTTSYSPDAQLSLDPWSNLGYSLRGHVRLFFGGRFNQLRDLVNPLIVILIGCLVVAVLLLIIQTIRHLRFRHRTLEPRKKIMLLLALLWTIIYVAFLFVWLPQNTFYRLFYLPALILLLGLVLSSFQPPAPTFRTALFVAAVVLANFLFLIYPYSHVQKYPPLAFALQINREWPAGTVIYYAVDSSNEELLRYFNPGTSWRRLSPVTLEAELSDVRNNGATAWLETTAIERLRSTPDGARWLDAHALKGSLKELDDGSCTIRFVQVVPAW